MEKIDLSQLDSAKGAEKGFTLTLRHPKTDAELPWQVMLLGADSEAYKDRAREFARARAARFTKLRKMQISPEELEAEAIELLVVATTGWQGMTRDGQPFEYSNDNARELYRKYPWIREQVDAAVGDRANFL
jgi:hypothetical protein